jgi:CBS domain-containing protein
MDQESKMRLPVHIRELMQSEALETFPDELLSEAASRMRDHQVGSLVVVEANELVGILSERDILTAIAEGLSPDSTTVASCMTREPSRRERDEPSGTSVTGLMALLTQRCRRDAFAGGEQ